VAAGQADVLVVGAGPGGSGAAHGLAAQGLRALLLDRAEFPREKVCGDGLTPRAVAALDAMGVLASLGPLARPVAEVDLVAPGSARVTATVPPPAMAVVRRVDLDDAIRRKAVEAGAVFEGGVRVDAVVPDAGGVTVHASRGGSPATYRARLAIVATGASIALLRQMNILRRPPATMLAARAYAGHAAPRVEIHFAGVPLPGYGWVFPVTADSANVGVGFFRTPRRTAPSSRGACERFLDMLGGTHDAIRSYPLRVDFPASPVWTERVLLAGEAAGLVNPLTGEGIDYALESGRIAAEHAAAFVAGETSGSRFGAAGAAYERALRRRFERLFAVCRLLRNASARPSLLDRLVGVAGRRDDLTLALVNIVLGIREPMGAAALRGALAKALTRG
jgi:menaquinone-9 beta-reductase